MEDLKFSNFIGDGTYGFVVTAWKGAQEVAVKFIFRSKIPSTAWKQDPVLGTVPTEIFYLSTLSHPNLVKLLGYYDDGKEYIIAVTELHGTSWDSANPVLQRRRYEGLRTMPRAQRVGSEGKGDLNTLSSLNAKQREMLRPRVSCDLFECIDAHDYFPERVVRHIFRQVVDVVAYLHQHNIVHRDLKDENIVIDEHYNIKLIDFGSAAEIPTATQPLFDKFLGTMDFAAPEIIEGYKYRGPEVEIWALGVLLYILVFRQIPFKSQQDTVAVNYKKPKELIDYYSGAVELYDLLDQMMVKDANRRARIEEVQSHPWMHMRT
ncbi:kinase-like domain-containing protein [Catenaria anguillulae PL171]|uniref:Kinase-like domain-containing protein n=1 Tax=Catenaria anguillulae PL171 TaxID=765915 RepID=A0A1Y2HSW7_9FUNG|nr:kinase-like domain-containing protein [Catenaria anguillulae PL171]